MLYRDYSHTLSHFSVICVLLNYPVCTRQAFRLFSSGTFIFKRLMHNDQHLNRQTNFNKKARIEHCLIHFPLVRGFPEVKVKNSCSSAQTACKS